MTNLLREHGKETAIWFPYSYELDQPIEVGRAGDSDSFKPTPDYIANEGLRVFYHGDWSHRR